MFMLSFIVVPAIYCTVHGYVVIHSCACLKPGPRFTTLYDIVFTTLYDIVFTTLYDMGFIMCSELRSEMIVPLGILN